MEGFHGVAARLKGGVLCAAAVLAIGLASTAAQAAGAWKVGDRVSVWVSGDYYDGRVVGIGSGSNAGQYLIHFDKFTSEQYALAKNVVARRGAPPPAPKAKCQIMTINGLPACVPGSVRR
jgi:hypothetical protein